MLWTELLFSYFPIDKNVFWQRMMARFCFLFLAWLTGFLAYALDGLMTSYIMNLSISLGLFGTIFLVLLSSYVVPGELNNLIQNSRPMLKLDDSLFQKFSERLERYSYSFFPCLFIGIGFFLLWALWAPEFQQVLAEGFKLHLVWNISFCFFASLLVATGVWIHVSVWLTIFLISRQPLNVELSPETIKKFRALSILSLQFSLVYFLTFSIANVAFLAGAPALSLLEIVVSPFVFFIAIGIIGVLVPFYNIHNALITLKKQELSRIEEESEQLLQQLDEVLAKHSTRQNIDQTITIMARLFSLQVKERHVKAAKEWSIDIGFLSKLIVVCLIPIIARIAAQIFTQYF
jgi:hypothetical protein